MRKTTFIFAGIISAVIGTAYAAGENTVTSKSYVDTQDALKQNKLHTASATPANNGTTVVTYTDTEGTPGERGIATNFTAFARINAETGDLEEPDADELVTGSWVKGAMESVPTKTTTGLVCYNSPACTLWTIQSQTVMKARECNLDSDCTGCSFGLNVCEEGTCSCLSV